MAWADLDIVAVGEIIETDWGNQVRANFAALKLHAHTGASGDGGTSLGPLVLADFTTAAAPAAPGAGKGRFYVVTSDRPGFRSGAAGAAEQLATLAGTETLTAKTLTTPTIGDLTNAQHGHTNAAGGGTLTGLPSIIRKTADETVNNSAALQNDDHFSFAIGANEIWTADLWIEVTHGSNEGLKCTFTAPAGAAMKARGEGIAPTNGANSRASSGATPGTAFFDAAVVASGQAFYSIHAVFVNGATPGTIQFQWAQNNAQVTNTIMLANSYMIAHKVA